MSEQTSQEPTMEEILASIRRIISEDDTPAEDAAADAAPAEAPSDAVAEQPIVAEVAAPEPAAAPAPEPIAAASQPELAADEEEELELTEKVETHGDLDIYSAPAEPPAAPAAVPPLAPSGGLVSDQAAFAAASSFGALSAAILMPKGDRTLEDVVRALLRPMLQQWLDDNLPTIVQTAVEAEVERIARSRVR
jgi:cell pole-organizing protein PopZ